MKYLQFPLMLIRDVHKDPEQCKQKILKFALVDFALKQVVTPEDTARQMVYDCNQGKAITELQEEFDQLPEEDGYLYDPDYNGFDITGTEINLTEDAVEILKKHEKLMEAATLNCQLSKINSFFGVTGPSPDVRLRNYNTVGEEVEKEEAKNGTDPRPTIEKNLFFDLINEPELFAAYMAIRSLEGQRKYTATNRPTIAGRMAGYKSAKILPKNNRVFKKYSNSRYYFDKLINRLVGRSLVKSMLRQKNWSRFYISTKLSSEELGTAIAKNKIKHEAKRNNDIAMQTYLQVYNETGI